MALTKASLIDLNANELILDLDADTSITADSDDTIDFKIGGSDEIKMTATALSPASSDGNALGTAALEWSDLYLADGALIYFGDDQDTTLTHADGSGLTLNSTNKLMFNDASQFVQGSSATVLSIGATDEVDITATLVDINANVEISGTATTTGVHTFSAVPVLPANSIDSAHYVDGSIDLAHMSSESVDEDNLYISNSGSNGQFLSKQSGNNGGLTWATVSTSLTGVDDQSSSNDDQLTITDSAIIINEDSDDLDFRVESNGNANRMVINGGDNTVLFGTDTSQTLADLFAVQIFGTTQAEAGLAITRNSANNGYPNLVFGKSRNTSPGSFTIVQDNDYLGQIHWHADDGTDMASTGASITARIDGTPGANDVPTELMFATTADGGNDPAERLNIGSEGDVTVSTGDLIFGTAGKGICLGATSNTDANTLEDYEEGTWTPSLSVVPSGVTLGTVATANYTKIGDRVLISMTCIILSSSDPAPSSDMRMIGFPFANADASVIMPAVLNYNYKPTPQLMMNGNGYFYYQSTTVGGNNQEPVGSGLDDSSRLSLAIQYRTTA